MYFLCMRPQIKTCLSVCLSVLPGGGGMGGFGIDWYIIKTWHITTKFAKKNLVTLALLPTKNILHNLKVFSSRKVPLIPKVIFCSHKSCKKSCIFFDWISWRFLKLALFHLCKKLSYRSLGQNHSREPDNVQQNAQQLVIWSNVRIILREIFCLQKGRFKYSNERTIAKSRRHM